MFCSSGPAQSELCKGTKCDVRCRIHPCETAVVVLSPVHQPAFCSQSMKIPRFFTGFLVIVMLASARDLGLYLYQGCSMLGQDSRAVFIHIAGKCMLILRCAESCYRKARP